MEGAIVCVAIVTIEAEGKRAIGRRGVQDHAKVAKPSQAMRSLLNSAVACSTCWNQRAAAGKSCTQQCTWEIFIRTSSEVGENL